MKSESIPIAMVYRQPLSFGMTLSLKFLTFPRLTPSLKYEYCMMMEVNLCSHFLNIYHYVNLDNNYI